MICWVVSVTEHMAHCVQVTSKLMAQWYHPFQQVHWIRIIPPLYPRKTETEPDSEILFKMPEMLIVPVWWLFTWTGIFIIVITFTLTVRLTVIYIQYVTGVFVQWPEHSLPSGAETKNVAIILSL
jgi:hypothetical protein